MPSQLAKFLRGVIFGAFNLGGYHMKAVNDAPSNPVCIGLKARICEQFKGAGGHARNKKFCKRWLGHWGLAGFIKSR